MQHRKGSRHAEQSAALRRKADRLHVLREKIDRYASKDAGAKHALLGNEIMVLHETARRLMPPTPTER